LAGSKLTTTPVHGMAKRLRDSVQLQALTHTLRSG